MGAGGISERRSCIPAFYSFFFFQKANVTVLSDSTCRDSYGQGDIADSMICVEVIFFIQQCNNNIFLFGDMYHMI